MALRIMWLPQQRQQNKAVVGTGGFLRLFLLIHLVLSCAGDLSSSFPNDASDAASSFYPPSEDGDRGMGSEEQTHDGTSSGVVYSRQWAVHVEGGRQVADSIAAKHGFINLGEIVEDTYHFHHNDVARRSADPSEEHHGRLTSEPSVKWAKQQVIKRRVKRDFMPFRPRSSPRPFMPNDPRWPQMWYLNRGGGLDMNVKPAWQEGITGRGVVVTILDDGLEKDHPDLFRNYDPEASFDVNNHDEDPMPRYDLIDSNRHGTRCAGEVAATANNSICAVGVAFGAGVGGVRMLDGDVTDAVEARSLSLNPQHVDIYSASWGPDDDGKTVDGPGALATRAFMEGVTKGRGGKGSIFVWASGNGGRDHDNCNCDGYTNSIWTLSISSATENGLVPWYSEACSSTLATTYSSGSTGEKQVVTTDLHHQCTTGHTGTSASAPLAAGICALALEANRRLTWRDMQHIVVRTAKPANLKAPDWSVNGVGRNVSHSFGYGLMDASAMVRMARTWKTVPEQHRCEVLAPHTDRQIPAKSQVVLKLEVKECAGVSFLEHVQAKISLVSPRRGDLQIHLTSPAGTRATLLARRPHDISRSGFQLWPFMSVHSWGEKPLGIWQLEIHNEGRYLATLTEWNMLLHGTGMAPGIDSSIGGRPGEGNGIAARNSSGMEGSKDKGGVGGLDVAKGGGGQVLPMPADVLVGGHGRARWKQDGGTSKGTSSPQGGVGPSQRNNNNNNKDSGNDGFGRTSASLGGDMVVLAPSGCNATTRGCIECSGGLVLREGKCESPCPEQRFYANPTCLPCHYSCKSCSGPNDYECTECFGDATPSHYHISNQTAAVSYRCIPSDVFQAMVSERWSFWVLVALLCYSALVSFVLAYLFCRKCSMGAHLQVEGHVYEKLRVEESFEGGGKRKEEPLESAY
ncbi:furin-like protease kpc-1 [Hetaerina americana]|uniref:furin-like protease kpc-1 n=1 Tax=Hetaerina americana TaxID=62018 RepID=UPI003A7F2E4E